jgi:pimeloyl-ACP methyl ester carboxylesterase
MTVVLVHGAPNTAELWEPLQAVLGDVRTIAVALPGFGTPLPDGFAATRWGYRDWLIEQIEEVGEPVDLVGHDQGAIISQGVLLARPDLVRSIVLTGAVADDDYHWHPIARIWQTPGLGEAQMAEGFALDPEQLAQGLAQMSGLALSDACRIAAKYDATMGDAMLTLYRSEPSRADWTLRPDRTYPPSLVLWGAGDQAQDGPRFGGRAAEVMGGRYVEIPGTGHYWMLDRAEQGAAILRDFWRAADGPVVGGRE